MNAFSTMDSDLESALAPWPGNEVVQLREWGTDRIYRLPEPPVENWFVGRSAPCAVWQDPAEVAIGACCLAAAWFVQSASLCS